MSTFNDRAVRIGVATATVLGSILAVLGLSTAGDLSSPFAVMLPLSLPIGMVLAWHHAGPVVGSRPYPIGRVVLMSLQALVVGAAGTGAIGVLGGRGVQPVTSFLDALGSVAGTALLGIVFLGIPMLGIIVPTVSVWAAVVRRLHRATPEGAAGDALWWAAMWAGIAAASLIGSIVAWPLLATAGLGEVGWFVSLILWIVLTPISVTLAIAGLRSLLQAGQSRREVTRGP